MSRYVDLTNYKIIPPAKPHVSTNQAIVKVHDYVKKHRVQDDEAKLAEAVEVADQIKAEMTKKTEQFVRKSSHYYDNFKTHRPRSRSYPGRFHHNQPPSHWQTDYHKL